VPITTARLRPSYQAMPLSGSIAAESTDCEKKLRRKMRQSGGGLSSSAEICSAWRMASTAASPPSGASGQAGLSSRKLARTESFLRGEKTSSA
jgi:hypothetical protein